MFAGATAYPKSRFTTFLLVVALLCTSSVGAFANESVASNADATCELWLISTRGIPSSVACHDAAANYAVCRHACQTGWTDAELADLLGDDFAGVTLFYIHGNDSDAAEARTEGLLIYRKLCAARCGELPLRVVIWSWPSERSSGPFRGDAQAKAARALVEGRLLAGVIDQLPPDAPVSLIGYSFGARVATSALQLLAGGSLNGRPLVNRVHSERSPLRVALVAAAVDSGSLAPGGKLGLALTQVDRVLITINSSDRVLRFYPLLYGRGGPAALGYSGPSGLGRWGGLREVVTQWDVSEWLRHSHTLERYLSSPVVVRKLANAVLFQDAVKTVVTE